MLKWPDFSPSQPRRLLHPPAQSLPSQPLCPGTRLVPGKAVASEQRLPFQACSCTLPRMARRSPPLRASNEGLLRPRVARAQGTHRAIPPLLADFFSILLDRDGNGLDDVEHHTLRLLEALCPHAMSPVQHDAVGQHDRRQFFDVVREAIVASADDR